MAATKECPSCGAQNDFILTNCMFCKTALPIKDIDILSDEELVENCGIWIGRLSGADKMTGAHIGNGYYYPYANVCSNANKYISILEVRSLKKPNLINLITTLNNRLNTALKSSEEFTREKAKDDEKKNKNEMYLAIGGLIVAAIVIGLALLYLSNKN